MHVRQGLARVQGLVHGVRRLGYKATNHKPGLKQLALVCRDKSVPKDWYKADGITIIPKEKDAPQGPLENIQKFLASASQVTLPVSQ